MSLWALLLGEQIVSLNSHVFTHSSFNDTTDFYLYFLRTTEQTNTKLGMFPWLCSADAAYFRRAYE